MPPAVLKIFLCLTLPFFVSCSVFQSSSNSKQDPIIKLEIVSTNSSSIANGTQTQFIATGISSSGELVNLSSDVAWSSSDTNIASPIASDAGFFKAHSPGLVQISASYKNLVVTSPLTITSAELSKLEISPAILELPSGFSHPLEVTGIFSDSTKQTLNNIIWSLNDPKVASISKTGKLTALTPGQAIITAQPELNKNFSQNISLTVTDATLSKINLVLVNKAYQLPKGTRTIIEAIGLFSDNSKRNLSDVVTWSSSDENILNITYIDNGKAIVEATNEGNASITALFSGISTEIPLSVSSAEIIGISIETPSLSTPSGQSIIIDAIGLFSDGSKKNISNNVYWFSSDESIASVSNAQGNNRGLITPKQAGKITITAFYNKITQELPFEVSAAVITTLNISTNKTNIPAGVEVRFFATGIFSDGSQQDFTNKVVWRSNDESIAIIENAPESSGIVHTLQAGTVLIKSAYQGLSAETTLDVSAPVISQLEIQPSVLELAKGTQAEIQVMGIFSDGSKLDLTDFSNFTTSDSSANILNDINTFVYAATIGSATITALYKNISAELPVTITNAVLVKLEVSTEQVQIPVTLSSQINATGIFSDGSKQNLTQVVSWWSSNDNIAIISNTDLSAGIMQGISTGSVLIGATIDGLSDTIPLEIQAIELLGMQIESAVQSLPAGLSTTVRAIATFSDGSIDDISSQVSWLSSNPMAVLLTSSNTAITAVNPGTSTITATFGNISSTLNVTANAAIMQSLEISPANINLPIGLSQQFVATAIFSDNTTLDVTTDVTWTSDSESNASIANTSGASGLLLGLTKGSVNIKAQLNGIERILAVQIDDAVLETIEITPGILTLAKGNQLQLQATGQYSDNSTQDLTHDVIWSSENEQIATVSNVISNSGLLSALTTGSTQISAILSGISRSLNVEISNAVLQRIDIAGNISNIPLGTQDQLTVIGTYSDQTSQDLTSLVSWTAGDQSIINIDTANGQLFALAEGETFVSASYSGVTGTYNISVTSATLESIELDISDVKVANLTGIQFKALGSFSDGSTKDLTQESLWTSSSAQIASANNITQNKGWVDALSPGVVTISARYNEALTASTTLTVIDATLESISITSEVTTFAKGTLNPLQAIGYFSGNLQQPLTRFVNWAVNDASIASISNTIETKGVLSGLQAGTVIASALFAGISANKTLAIVDNPTLPVGLALVALPNVIFNDGIEETTISFFVRAADRNSSVADTTEINIEVVEGDDNLTSLNATKVNTINGAAGITLSSTYAGIIRLKVSVTGTTISRNLQIRSTDDLAKTIAGWVSISSVLEGNTLKTDSEITLSIVNGSSRPYTLLSYKVYNETTLLGELNFTDTPTPFTAGSLASSSYTSEEDLISPALRLVYELKDDISNTTFEFSLNINL